MNYIRFLRAGATNNVVRRASPPIKNGSISATDMGLARSSMFLSLGGEENGVRLDKLNNSAPGLEDQF
jgi:hypothetical protein